jgi:hypothetical protein
VTVAQLPNFKLGTWANSRMLLMSGEPMGLHATSFRVSPMQERL